MISITCALLLFIVTSIEAAFRNSIKHDINWNPSITEGLSKGKILKRDVRINEYMDIFCPQFDMDTPEEQMLQFVVYNVSADAFEQCNFNKNFKKMLICDKPRRSKKLTIKFQKYSPNPLGFVYKPDKSYFFMAVPQGYDPSMTSCHDVMRLMINVHPKRHHEHTRASTTTTTMKSTTKTTAQPATTQLVSTAAASTTTIETTTTKVASLKRTMSSTDKGVTPRTERLQDPGNSSATMKVPPLSLFWIMLFSSIAIIYLQ